MWSRPNPSRTSLASSAGMTLARAARPSQCHPVQAYGAARRGPKARDPCTAPHRRAHAYRRASGEVDWVPACACERPVGHSQRRDDVGERGAASPSTSSRAGLRHSAPWAEGTGPMHRADTSFNGCAATGRRVQARMTERMMGGGTSADGRCRCWTMGGQGGRTVRGQGEDGMHQPRAGLAGRLADGGRQHG